MIDKLVTDLKKRSEVYHTISQLFGCLLHLLIIDETDLKFEVNKLAEFYAKNFNENLLLELKQFISLMKLQPKGFFSNRSQEVDKTNDKILGTLKVLN